MILCCKNEDGSETKIRLKTLPNSPPVTVGRGKEADICIEDSKCSRVHCAIRYWGTIFVIKDEHSSNGTLVNGEKIEVARLAPGDLVKIGNTELRLLAEESRADATMRG